MTKSALRSTITILGGVLALSLLAGCGSSEVKLDGAATVVTVNDEAVPMGVLSLYTRRSQAQTEAMYRSFLGSSANIWSTVADEATGLTYGDDMVSGSLETLEKLVLLKQKAADYGVVLTDEDKDAIAAAASAFMEANTEEAIEALAVTQEQVESFLELMTYQNKMHSPVVSDADTDVDEAEAQQASFTYANISFAGMEDADKEELKGKAQEALDAVLADESADFAETIKGVDDTFTTSTGTFTYAETDNEYLQNSYDEAVITALRTLEDGKYYPELVETDSSYYILRMDKVNDEDATLSKIDSEITSIENAFYNDTVDGWLEEATVTVDEKVLGTLKVADDHSFTLVYSEEEEAEEAAEVETEEAGEMATGEAAEETTEAVVEAATGEAAEATTEAVEAATEAAAEEAT
ncbi:MAG: FKBP-type peptidylprolyl isomerase, partial [Blautia sp.]|nr:FKBP-type peptidylprolyl isomerase [Blautia sp.]